MDEKIRDRCPSCGHDTLFIGNGGWLTCGWLPCSEPGVSRAVTKLQERLAALGTLPKQLCALVKHVCVSCDLDENEYAERAGYNVGIQTAIESVKSALTFPAGATPSDQGVTESAQDSSSVPNRKGSDQ